MRNRLLLKGIKLLFLLLFISSYSINAQVFWTETFTNGCTSNCNASAYTGTNGAWTITQTGTNQADNNQWYVSSAEDGNDVGACATQTNTDECLHIGSSSNVFGDLGASFLNNSGGIFSVNTDLRVESPVVNCTGQTSITIAFNYIENGDGTNDNATLWYFDGSSWSQIADMAKTALCPLSEGTWTSFSQTLPATADNNANVRIGFRWVNNDDAVGDDPSIAIDDIMLSATSASTDSITTGAISAGPFCGCDTVNVPFVSSGTFNAGNSYTVQLSDATGSFATPVGIGSLASTANSGTVNATLPCSTVTGAGYLVRVISSSPSIIGDDNGVAVTITTAVVPSVSITATVSGSICTDTALFTATPVNGGTNPVYQWQINGVNAGTDSSDFNPNLVLGTGDIISVILTSNAACTTVDSVQVDTVINCTSVTMGALAGSSFCGCDSINVPFTSTGVFGTGNTYTAQLSDATGDFTSPVDIGTLVSTANAGTINSVIPCATLQANNYLIRVISSVPADTSLAGLDTLIINSVIVPSVTMNTTATKALCIDTAVTFTATPVNGGSAPMYQWQRNGVNVGGNSPIYTTSGSFMMGDVITVIMVSNEACTAPDTVQDFMIIDCPQIEIPNVFTPNNDGINDLFRVNLSGRALTSFRIDIYDRWGLLMFSSTSINNKWDGRTTAGLPVVDGTYFYVVDLNGTSYKGHITVLH